MNSTENFVLNDQVNISSSAVVLDVQQPPGKGVEASPPSPLPGNGELPPEFKTTLVDIEVTAGSSAKFVVQVYNPSQSLKVSWYHNGLPVDSSDRTLILQQGDFYCVHINQVYPIDEGQWTCRAENVAGGMSCCCILHVTCPPVFCPPEFLTGLKGNLWDNGTISLECEVKGMPMPTLSWYMDGNQIHEGASLTIRAGSNEPETLLGIFACEANNCCGSSAIYCKVYARNFTNFLSRFTTKKQLNVSEKQTDNQQLLRS
ncbi:Titin [Orchesella cincta]|uniref:Titin n=1 Tax=Orchesella cincta TaxID=48709 RepID=A0A1D2NFT3_ORCCI|nr:Titin [Orchesella cincta]